MFANLDALCSLFTAFKSLIFHWHDLWETGGGTTLNFIPSSTYSSNMRTLQYFKLKCLMQTPPDMERKNNFRCFYGLFTARHDGFKNHLKTKACLCQTPWNLPESLLKHRRALGLPREQPHALHSHPAHLLQFLPQLNQARGHGTSARSFGPFKRA